jgi:hypothetical protein
VLGACPRARPSSSGTTTRSTSRTAASELARSPICTQAFKLDDRPGWAIQFHAEVTLAMLDAWVEEDPDELPMPALELRAESERVIGRSNAQGRWLADAFLREAAAAG